MVGIQGPSVANAARDLKAGLVVFLVALPLSLGVALASHAPLFAGIVAGVVGGMLVGLLSGSHTSVSGSSAGLTAVIAVQIVGLGFPTFLLALALAGLIQIALGVSRAGFVAAFFPSSVIKGQLAAVGVILVLKQIPHLVGYDPDPEWSLAFREPNDENTFSTLFLTLAHIDSGAVVVSLVSIVILVAWERSRWLKGAGVPAPLAVILLGVAASRALAELGEPWAVDPRQFVRVPVTDSWAGFVGLLQGPDLSQWRNPAVYTAAVTLAAIASLETLLNLEAVDKLDPRQRTSPPSRELLAQGVGNVACGLFGGLPVTSAIVRGSVSINAGGRTKLATMFHGALLLGSVALLADWLNLIPLACLAAILLVTGVKLASPALVRQMWAGGRAQFVPFATTVTAIVFTDLLVGVLIGLGCAAAFILWSNARRPIRRVMEKHLGGEVLHVELPNQVSFLNRAALLQTLDAVPPGGHVLLDGRASNYIDPDVLDLIRDFAEQKGPARGVTVSLAGFRRRYQIENQIQFVDFSTRELQEAMTPDQVLQILKDGHARFRAGRRLTRDLGRQVEATADAQHPLAVVLSCIDSRAPVELIFDLGVGDVFGVRVAGHVVSRDILGSVEYGCAVVGAKLVLVMGHTRCGAVGAAVTLARTAAPPAQATGCQHLDRIVWDIQRSVDPHACRAAESLPADGRQAFVDAVARLNVRRVVAEVLEQSGTLAALVRDGRLLVVGAMYDVATGGMEFLTDADDTPDPTARVPIEPMRKGWDPSQSAY
jgi:carbonic anhydrase/SulP family sulfate permease